MKAKVSPIEHRDFLLAAAAWQESLLQSYRSFHITIQGFLIAAGAAVLAVQLTSAIQEQTGHLLTNAIFNLIFTCLLAFLFWLQRKTASELKEVIKSRAEDINHWHKVIMLSENELDSSQRSFTYFKMWQHAHRKDVDHIMPKFLPADGLSSDAADELLGKGLGHTRRVLDVNLFDRVLFLSRTMLITSVGVTTWFTFVWFRST